MTLEGPIRQVETALASLANAARGAAGWSDTQRHVFDRQRMEPLAASGARLLGALQKAQEQCAKAETLLSGR